MISTTTVRTAASAYAGRRQGQVSAVVLVTHDIDQALTVADSVVVCQAGRTVEDAKPAQFTGDGSALRHPYSQALWQALPAHGFRLPDEVLR